LRVNDPRGGRHLAFNPSTTLIAFSQQRMHSPSHVCTCTITNTVSHVYIEL
jgi:hypothetical protein